MLDRRQILIGTGTLAGSLALPGVLRAQAPVPAPAAPPPPPPAFSLPPLGYPYEALEPHIDAQTMRIHHSAHHQAFITTLNTLAGTWTELRNTPIETILSDLNAVPETVRTPVRNNLGGHWNHDFFWKLMKPGGADAPTGDLLAAIERDLQSVGNLVNAVNAAGVGRFGSGWAWLVLDKDKKLAVIATPYQDTPLEQGATAIIGVDVWEHAYYLKHQNRRANYLRDWWNVVNWTVAGENFAKAA